jgi:hypothetical protein
MADRLNYLMVWCWYSDSYFSCLNWSMCHTINLSILFKYILKKRKKFSCICGLRIHLYYFIILVSVRQVNMRAPIRRDFDFLPLIVGWYWRLWWCGGDPQLKVGSTPQWGTDTSHMHTFLSLSVMEEVEDTRKCLQSNETDWPWTPGLLHGSASALTQEHHEIQCVYWYSWAQLSLPDSRLELHDSPPSATTFYFDTSQVSLLKNNKINLPFSSSSCRESGSDSCVELYQWTQCLRLSNKVISTFHSFLMCKICLMFQGLSLLLLPIEN